MKEEYIHKDLERMHLRGRELRKLMRLNLVILLIIMIFTIGCAKKTTPTHNENEIEVDYSDYFNGAEGTAVFYDSSENTYHVYQKELSEKRSSPCSSFKIISCLLGMESGKINSDDSLQKWNGTKYAIEEWNRDINYIDAFHYSCIWYYRRVLDSVGADYVQNALNQLEYGNCDISEWEGSRNNLIFPDQKTLSELNGFWQESSLEISPREQVDVQRKIFEDNSMFSKESLDLVKNVMLIDNTNPDIRIYGKTGSGVKDDTWADGWFVGMFEVKDKVYYFAVRFNDPDKRGSDAKEAALKIINNEFTKAINKE